MYQTLLILLPEAIAWTKACIAGDEERAKLETVKAMRKAKRRAVRAGIEAEHKRRS